MLSYNTDTIINTGNHLAMHKSRRKHKNHEKRSICSILP
jgi:hypothetical protein